MLTTTQRIMVTMGQTWTKVEKHDTLMLCTSDKGLDCRGEETQDEAGDLCFF